MLTITIPKQELFDEATMEFKYIPKDYTIHLEHSLISLSKWEAIWHKPFLTDKPKSRAETISYIQCMSLTQNVPDTVYEAVTDDDIRRITEYLKDPMTATTITYQDGAKRKSRKIITSELIYYWMFELKIPVQFEKWHLNRLMTLIEVCNAENTPPKKMGKRNTMRSNAALNAQRRAMHHSKG